MVEIPEPLRQDILHIICLSTPCKQTIVAFFGAMGWGEVFIFYEVVTKRYDLKGNHS